MRYTAVPVVVMLLVACGGRDEAAVGERVSLRIGPGESGGFKIGEGSLSIPAGAVVQEVTITAETRRPDGLPEAGTLTGWAYELRPAELQFRVPATLELPVEGSPGADREVVVSLEGGAWRDWPTAASGARATAKVDNLATFIVRFRPRD